MIENHYDSQFNSNSWTGDNFRADERQKIIRKFINSAIYVEKEVTKMLPQRKTSPIDIYDGQNENKTQHFKVNCLNNANGSQYENRICNKILTRQNIDKIPINEGDRAEILSNDSSVSTSEESIHSENTVKAKDIAEENSDLKLSLNCLITQRTDRTSILDPQEKQEIIRNWIAKKDLEIKRKNTEQARIKKQKEEQRERLLEKERETFKKWLAEKKKDDERKKIQKELKEQTEKLNEAEKEKKKIENEISYNLWLTKKKKSDLEKKIKEKLALLHMYEEKKIRIEENEKAYQEWLRNSKNRQKPVPMNRGLQSLCLSASVTYINPRPWTPNIGQLSKPSSQ